MSSNYFDCLYAARVDELCEAIHSVKSFKHANLRVDNHGDYGRSVTIVGVGWRPVGSRPS